MDVWEPTLTGHPTPPRPRALSPSEVEQLRKQTSGWLKLGVVERVSTVVWTNNPVFVAKKNGTIRVCIDCRPANAVTLDFDWPLPKLQELRHRLEGSKWFSRIDLRNAFFRVVVAAKWRYLTAFTSEGKDYQFKRMPFGLKTAPAVFQRWMDHVMEKHRHHSVWYIDDILIHSPSRRELRREERSIRETLIQSGNEVNEEKSESEQKSILFAGIQIYAGGVGPNPEMVTRVLNIPPPRTKKEKQSALGLVSYLRDFIPLVSLLTASLSERKGDAPITDIPREWTKLMEHIAKVITCISHWNEQDQADLYTDASGIGVAAVLIQNGRIVAVASRKLGPAETRYSTTDREHLSLLLAAQKFKLFLHRPEGVTETWNDHAALMNRKVNELTPRQSRWYATINQWIPRIKHVKGAENPADWFSRYGVETGGVNFCL